MTFSASQVEALSGSLNASRIKARTQAGRSLSYIEGWWAISEANRIFGFDGWHRETVTLEQLGEPREVDGKFRVYYLAKVRITVGDIVREGCGYGSGIDRDLGQAHESALKESETDAMKRALMTFGNPFGLALYDKEQNGVDHDKPKPTPVPTPSPKPLADDLNDAHAKAKRWAEEAVKSFSKMGREALNKWSNDNHKNIVRLREIDADVHAKLIAAMQERDFQLEVA